MGQPGYVYVPCLTRAGDTQPGAGRIGQRLDDRPCRRTPRPAGSIARPPSLITAFGGSASAGGARWQATRCAVPECDGAGRILAFTVTPGQMGDLRPAHGLLANLPPPAFCVADTAYDSNGLRHFLLGRGTTPVIPNNPTRKKLQPFDPRTYKARNIIERTIGRLKDWRRIHTRYNKLAANFASAVAIAAILIGWT